MTEPTSAHERKNASDVSSAINGEESVTVPVSVIVNGYMHSNRHPFKDELLEYLPADALWSHFTHSVQNGEKSPYEVLSEAIIYGKAFAEHQEFFKKISEFAVRYFIDNLNADNKTVNGNSGSPVGLSWFLEDEQVLVLLKGLENAQRSHPQVEIPYEIWNIMYASNYERKHWSNFTRTNLMVALNILMWRNMKPEMIHRLIDDKIVHEREEAGYHFLMNLAAKNLQTPAEWLKSLHPFQGIS